MRLLLTGRNVEVTPALRQLVERRIAKLERLLNDSMVSAQVVLTLQKYRHVTEVTVHMRGDHILHGLGGTQSWELSLSQALDKIGHQAHKVKDKWDTRKRRAAAVKTLPAMAPEPAEAAAPAPRRIIRASRYAIKPMAVEDAALRVESGPDAFLVFRNSATDTINIVYRRKDGHLGLIEPET